MNFFIARQPVFQKNDSIFAYKIIYSPLTEEITDKEMEESILLDNIMSVGNQTLSSG